MDVELEVNQGAYHEVHFNKSVPMSTYLTCFIVSDFEYKSVIINANNIGEDFEMRVYATPEQLNKVDYAVRVGKAVLEYYIDYFQIEYPLPKMGMLSDEKLYKKSYKL